MQKKEQRGWLFAGLVAVGAIFLCGAVRGETLMVENGRARAEIIIADNPARMTKLAAANLREYIEKITGAALPVTNAPGGAGVKIYVGQSRHTAALKISTAGLAHGAFRMVSGPDWLALLGPDADFAPMEPYTHDRNDKARAARDWDLANPGESYGFPYDKLGINAYCPELDVWEYDDGGTMNAVCEFLRSLGVRWYFPGELGEVVPRQASLALPAVDRTVKPDFPMRRFSYWHNDRDNRLWNLRLGANAGGELMGLTQNCHGSKWVYMRDEIKQAHPDWYALWGGQRATNHSYSGAPCLSSAGLFTQHLKFARMMFDARREPMLSLDVCDGYGQMCMCELCKGLGALERGWRGNMSDYVWDYVNRLAAELYKTHPDRKVSGLSYGAYSLAPEKIDKLSPNIALVFCQTRLDFHNRALREDTLQRRRDWLSKLPSGEFYIYDYYLQGFQRYGNSDIPVYFPRLIAEDLRSLKGVSMGDMIEVYRPPDAGKIAGNALAVEHLNIYVTARLWWDADQDLDALLKEFYTLFYGPAAAQMQAFVEYAEAHWPLMKTQVETIDKTFALLAAAREAAGDAIYGQRVDLVVARLKPLYDRRAKMVRGRQGAPRAVAVERKIAELKLDGKPDEPFWKDVPVYALKKLQTGEAPAAATTFQAVWSERNLVLGIRCADMDMANLHCWTHKDGDPNIYSDDLIELFLETPAHAYYSIAINPAGAILDMDRQGVRNTLWSAEAERAVHKGADGWSLEIKIPTADHIEGGLDPLKRIEGRKPDAQAPWYFNVCRQRIRGADRELSSFSPTGTARFGVPDKFGELVVE